MVIPENLLYSKTHEWVMLTGGKARIGLTDYAQDALGDIVYFNLPAVGDKFETGGVIGEVESVKAVSEVNAPVGGVVSAVNETLADAPETINSAPYDTWIFELDIDGEGNANSGGDGGNYGLLTPGQYEEFCLAEAGE
jgi:glycine cleavage system H protein